MKIRALIFAVLVACLAGCQVAKPLYYWGSYDTVTYQTYSAPGKASPESQIEQLKADVEKAKGGTQLVPPGVHAHLGWLYSQIGKMDLAAEEFAIERRLFPESAIFIDALAQRAQPAPKP